MKNMTPEDVIMELARRFGWPREDPAGPLRFKIKGVYDKFMPDHDVDDAGMVIEEMSIYKCRTFHFEPVNGGVRAYFENEEWAEFGATWRAATARAALRALREKHIGN